MGTSGECVGMGTGEEGEDTGHERGDMSAT